MRTSLMVLGAAVLCISVAWAGAPVHMASGGGTVDWPMGRVTYGFNAQIDAAGTVKGQAQFNARDTGTTGHVEINCLAVSGNTAWLGGTITSASDSTFVGDAITWAVQDNGEGSKATEPDKTSSVAVGRAAVDCTTMPPPTWIDWTNGNVQVK